ncbi:YihD family protein [Paraferrimonas haliotis]|uniref:DUF1040 family protein n=1 Tax=Paraferrimonas haliotis TaxID=2013866 RepID=A0AA37U1X2_9GAMM|nr:YihD family protein [Paraferrimonas haliotis]GLS84776.1 hypothetical protein GCM10007894_27530 [Paraferrimonas haliotis]
MSCHRIDELLELLTPVWQKNQQLNLAEMLQKLANEAGFDKSLNELTDDVLIYHLKMQPLQNNEMIPGIEKDFVEDYDFKKALLKARGFTDENTD